MIRSFKNKLTETVSQGRRPKRFPSDLFDAAQKKFAMLDAAAALNDLKSPPGNRLHRLSGNREGQHAIAVNDQFRLCFRWTEGGPEDVEFTDYH